MVLLEGTVIFILVAYAIAVIVPPVIFDTIWVKRIKNGKSKVIGPLGVISIIITIGSLMSLPHLFTIIGQYFGWIR